MQRPKKWTEKEFRNAVKNSDSLAQVIRKIGLVPAGGNYAQVKKYIGIFDLDCSHFLGKRARLGKKFYRRPVYSIEEILVKDSNFQSHKLKWRLINAGLKSAKCEECGWGKMSKDGRVPIELDHINGDSKDNMIDNLRILCPNCHSLKTTHRGRNKKRG